MSRLDDIEARLKAATPGPWRTGADHRMIGREDMVYANVDGGEDMIAETWGDNLAEDAALIAHAPADLAALLRVARAAQQWQSAHGDLMAVWEASDALKAALAALGEAA